MQLTRAADYAVRVMVHLAALPQGQRVSLTALAEATGAPLSFLSKVMQSLNRGALITSQRGRTGGFEISPRGRDASMREVIEVIDGPMSLNLCLNTGDTCARKGFCPAHPVWAKAQRAILDVLNQAMIAEMAAQLRNAEPKGAIHLVVVPRPGAPAQSSRS